MKTQQVDPQAIYKLVERIPPGRVITYGYIARLIGCNNPRVVGRILHNNPNPTAVPCHRVVNSRGQVAKNFAFGGAQGQIERLQAEGVVLNKGQLNLFHYLWLP